MPSPTAPALQRIVPGAPPPIALSKSQRKKKKSKGKPTDDDAENGLPDTPITANPEGAEEEAQDDLVPPKIAAQISTDSVEPHLSPIVELISKRLKAASKKMTRIQSYTTVDPETLNEDQRRLITTLPVLEAVQKELTEAKKAVEAQEAELAQELQRQKVDSENAIAEKISAAVSEAQNSSLVSFSGVLDVIRAHHLHSSGNLNLNPSDDAMLSAVASTLLSDDLTARQPTLQGLVSRSGEFNGVPYATILDVTASAFAPPQAPEPESQVADDKSESVEEPAQATNGDVPASITASNEIGFIQPSDLDEPLGASGEWVNIPSADTAQSPGSDVNGHSSDHLVDHNEPGAPAEGLPSEEGVPGIDWSEDHGELPSIDGLHAQFGTSGTVTPEEAGAAPPNGEGMTREEEGFTTAGGRPRGRGRGNYSRGGDRGARGGNRGRGGERGGYRGGRGGGERGFRGNRGEGRGRGRGRGGPKPPSDS